MSYKNIDPSKLKVKYWKLLGKSLQKQREKEAEKQQSKNIDLEKNDKVF